MAEIKKRTTKIENKGTEVKSRARRNKAAEDELKEKRRPAISGNARSKQGASTKGTIPKSERKSTRVLATDKKKKKEDKSCKSCRFYVYLKKTIEGKEIREPTCCFHWPMSNTKDMEEECSLYIKWEGSLHACK